MWIIQMLDTDDYIGVNGDETTTITITLMESPVKGKKVCIADITGKAETNNITINSNVLINGKYSAIINTNYGSITMIYNDITWSIIGFVN